MKKLRRPILSARSAYLTCISSVVQKGLAERLSGAVDSVVQASKEFDTAAARNTLHQIELHDLTELVCDSKDLINVYEERMRKKGSAGRHIYEAILNSPPNKKCPLCGHRDVSTLDHHLDKANYPLLAVAPLNLVPSCKDCNFVKLSFNPTSPEEETVHPYYDEVNDGIWLKAKLIEKRPVGIKFIFEPPPEWDSVKASRVKNHFRLFGLASLYNPNGANELLNIKYQYSKLRESSGETALHASLALAASSREKISLNSWQAALYRELASNSWYLSGGAF